jgi:hypothetical protein
MIVAKEMKRDVTKNVFQRIKIAAMTNTYGAIILVNVYLILIHAVKMTKITAMVLANQRVNTVAQQLNHGAQRSMPAEHIVVMKVNVNTGAQEKTNVLMTINAVQMDNTTVKMIRDAFLMQTHAAQVT